MLVLVDTYALGECAHETDFCVGNSDYAHPTTVGWVIKLISQNCEVGIIVMGLISSQMVPDCE